MIDVRNNYFALRGQGLCLADAAKAAGVSKATALKWEKHEAGKADEHTA